MGICEEAAQQWCHAANRLKRRAHLTMLHMQLHNHATAAAQHCKQIGVISSVTTSCRTACCHDNANPFAEARWPGLIRQAVLEAQVERWLLPSACHSRHGQSHSATLHTSMSAAWSCSWPVTGVRLPGSGRASTSCLKPSMDMNKSTSSSLRPDAWPADD